MVIVHLLPLGMMTLRFGCPGIRVLHHGLPMSIGQHLIRHPRHCHRHLAIEVLDSRCYNKILSLRPEVPQCHQVSISPDRNPRKTTL